MKQDWLLHRFIRYKFVSYGKQRLPHSSGDNRVKTLQAIKRDYRLKSVASVACHTKQICSE